MDATLKTDSEGCLIGCPQLHEPPAESCKPGFKYAIKPYACTQCSQYICVEDPASSMENLYSVGRLSIITFGVSILFLLIMILINRRRVRNNKANEIMLNQNIMINKNDSLYGSKIVDFRNSFGNIKAGSDFSEKYRSMSLKTNSFYSVESGVSGASGIFSTHGPVTVKALHNGQLVESKLALNRRSHRDSSPFPHKHAINSRISDVGTLKLVEINSIHPKRFDPPKVINLNHDTVIDVNPVSTTSKNLPDLKKLPSPVLINLDPPELSKSSTTPKPTIIDIL
ncbi:hypothetical protein AYI70_g11228 [Smittium culicis]|uniref:Uncharacterized protein n=1 Tax=Smittium culicis TaxID=133412 RepID=A0A1R1X2Q6_9FUNG|nr:hypothetical protein AYI70_g11615 [Smittium culicis]OMJ08926.1 hypothetical protein AYI70_g11228 [Smittium culicis]